MSQVPCRRVPAWRVVLPAIVGDNHFDQVIERLRRGEIGAPFVLDLSRVRHVRYRALLGFVSRLRAFEIPGKSVVLDGVSSYVHAIFGYVLSQADWELFEISVASAPGEHEIEAARLAETGAPRLRRAATESWEPTEEAGSESSGASVSDAFVERLVRTAGFGPN